MIIFSFALIATVALVSVLTRERYAEITDGLDKRDYPVRGLLGFGLFILDITGLHNIKTMYTTWLKAQYGQLYGPRYADAGVKIHYANILVYIALAEAVIALINAVTHYAAPIFTILLPLIIFFSSGLDLKRRIKKRNILIQLHLPELINTLVLLVNAGMTVRRAWEKIAADNGMEGPLKEEIRLTAIEIKSGKSELKAYEDFARRCRVPEVSRFVSMLALNLRKGSSQLVSVLRISANDSWQSRKNAAKRLGEEASTKLVFPLMLMFAAVLLIVATPAVLALRGI